MSARSSSQATQKCVEWVQQLLRADPERLDEKYKNPSELLQQIRKLFSQTLDLRPAIDTYGHTKEKLLQLDGVIEINYHNHSYYIPVVYWLPLHFPSVAPHCYVKPSADMVIKANHTCVHPLGAITHRYLTQWNGRRSHLTALTTTLASDFSLNPPLIRKRHQNTAIRECITPPPPPVSESYLSMEKREITQSEEAMVIVPPKTIATQLAEWFLSDVCRMDWYIDRFVEEGACDLSMICGLDENDFKTAIGMSNIHTKHLMNSLSKLTLDREQMKQFMSETRKPPLAGFWQLLEREGILSWECLAVVVKDNQQLAQLLRVSPDNECAQFMYKCLDEFRQTRLVPQLQRRQMDDNIATAIGTPPPPVTLTNGPPVLSRTSSTQKEALVYPSNEEEGIPD